MIGYGPAAEAIREADGLPYATGADDPDYWHPVGDHWTGTATLTGASGAGLPGTSMQPSDQAETGILYLNAPAGEQP